MTLCLGRVRRESSKDEADADAPAWERVQRGGARPVGAERKCDPRPPGRCPTLGGQFPATAGPAPGRRTSQSTDSPGWRRQRQGRGQRGARREGGPQARLLTGSAPPLGMGLRARLAAPTGPMSCLVLKAFNFFLTDTRHFPPVLVHLSANRQALTFLGIRARRQGRGWL